MGSGMSQEIDSNMAGRALMWSYGGSDPGRERAGGPELRRQTVAAVEFMAELFEGAMTEEVFAWNAA